MEFCLHKIQSTIVQILKIMVFKKKSKIKSYIIVRGWIFPSEEKWDLKTEIYGLNSENCKYRELFAY